MNIMSDEHDCKNLQETSLIKEFKHKMLMNSMVDGGEGEAPQSEIRSLERSNNDYTQK